MNRDEAMNALRKSINILLGKQEEVKEVKLTDVQTKDGKTLSTETEVLEIGSVLYGVDDQGNQIPVEDGSYELEDGKTIEVKDSIVTEIAEASEEVDEVEVEEEMSEAPVEEEVKIEEEGSDTESRISKLETDLAELMSMMQSMSENSVKLTSKVEEFASQPASEPIKSKVVIEKQLSAEELRTQRFLTIKNNLIKN